MPDEKPQDETPPEDEEGFEEDDASEEGITEEEPAEDEEYQEDEEEQEEEPVYEDPDALVTIKTFVFPYQALAAKLHMDEVNIPASLADLEFVSMDWFLGGAVGNIKLQVRRCDVPAAITALEDLQPPPAPEGQPADEESDSTVCLSCGQAIPEETTSCPSCGWSYADDEETHFREGQP